MPNQTDQHTHPEGALSLSIWRQCSACQREAKVHADFMELAVPMYAREHGSRPPVGRERYGWQRLIVRDALLAIDLVSRAGFVAEAAQYGEFMKSKYPLA